MMSYEWHDVLGNVGVVMVISGYFLVQVNKIDTQGILFSLLNTVGAGLLSVSLYIDFNFSGLAMELSWLLISLFGLARCYHNNSVSRKALKRKALSAAWLPSDRSSRGG